MISHSVRCRAAYIFQSSLMQKSMMNSYKLFFFASSSKSSPVFFLRVKSIMYVSNHNFTISFFCSIFISPDKIAQNRGVLLKIMVNFANLYYTYPSTVCKLNISYLSLLFSNCSMRNWSTLACP